MKCSQCGSNNVNIQVVTETKLKRKHHGIAYWLLIGWWLEMFLWLFLTLPRLLCMLFGHKKQKIVNKNYKMAVCQDCGNTWRI